jgi:hypothetical protein
MVIFQLDVVHNWANKLPQKSMDEKLSPLITQRSLLSFISHKMIAYIQKHRVYFWQYFAKK